MNARCALGAVAALTIASHSFASDPQNVDIGSFVNTGTSTISYVGSFSDFVSHEIVDGRNVIGVNVTGILDSLGYDTLWSVTITDAGTNSYGSLSPGADIDLFRIDGASGSAIYSYLGPNAVHQVETADILQERELQLDSFSGAQDAWNITHVSLGFRGSITASWTNPLQLHDFITPGPGIIDTGMGFGPGSFSYTPPPQDSEGGSMPVVFISEHGTFEAFSVSVMASSTVPAPGALALLGIAGFVGSRRRRAK